MNEERGGGPEQPRAIVVGHGEFAGGLVSAVGQICGMADKLVVLSMMGMTPEDIEGTIREQLARTGARVIFTDLPAGSATLAAHYQGRSRYCSRERSKPCDAAGFCLQHRRVTN